MSPDEEVGKGEFRNDGRKEVEESVEEWFLFER
jgi:hypothetical protein